MCTRIFCIKFLSIFSHYDISHNFESSPKIKKEACDIYEI